MLFTIKQQPFLTFQQVLDSEMIAEEVVRTFTGSIGLVLAVQFIKVLKTDK
ncbi:MAG TPA: YibE/F family protein [Candidatus Bipolaricaulota bacterium]|nr:YibE/F family protein [Candidatus Bipolaricaulota bacterium]